MQAAEQLTVASTVADADSLITKLFYAVRVDTWLQAAVGSTQMGGIELLYSSN